MKLIGKILFVFGLLIVLIMVGVSLYIDLPVFKSKDTFKDYLNNYNNVSYVVDDKVNELKTLDNEGLFSKELNRINIENNDVIISYFKYGNPFSARKALRDYQEISTGNIETSSFEINIPFYGRYWTQNSKGYTSIAWVRNNKVTLIRSKDSATAKMVKEDIQNYLK
ncbi:MAG: hypothetical protein K9K76_01755 [Halanaerobiales bacterium]|nr:hypothetical protein [Halanaerobiales bacterium]